MVGRKKRGREEGICLNPNHHEEVVLLVGNFFFFFFVFLASLVPITRNYIRNDYL